MISGSQPGAKAEARPARHGGGKAGLVENGAGANAQFRPSVPKRGQYIGGRSGAERDLGDG